jgi:hypothetical protein
MIPLLLLKWNIIIQSLVLVFKIQCCLRNSSVSLTNMNIHTHGFLSDDDILVLIEVNKNENLDQKIMEYSFILSRFAATGKNYGLGKSNRYY